MNDFSSTQEVGDPRLSCRSGNLFYCAMSPELQSSLGIKGYVNGKGTPALPTKIPYVLTNECHETINALEIEVSGRRKPIIKNVRDFGNINEAWDLKTAVSIPIINTGHRGSDQSMLISMSGGSGSGTGIGSFEIQDTAGLPLGKTRVSELTDEQKARLGVQLGPIFGVQIKDIQEGYSSKPSELTQTAIGIAEGILKQGNAAAVGGVVRQRIIRHVAVFEAIVVSEVVTVRKLGSAVILSFETRISYLRLVQASSFASGGFAAIDAKTQGIPSASQMAKSSAGGVFKGTGGVFLVVGAGLNIAEWFSKEPGERFISDLLVDLSVMVGVAVVSAIAATALIALFAPAAVVAAGGVAVTVAVGAAALAIGWVITEGWNLISSDVKKFIRDIDWYKDVYKGGMTDEEISEGMKIAP